ncbi:MAG: glycoside hydrolase family 92 protein, partial [Muribaculaceae bacterium]|nr:glycoside hydrolase family 92 protein [Muribaculaceae bacterium]
DSIEVVSTPIIKDGVEIGKGDVAYFYFTTTDNEQITVATAISCTGEEGAKLNLEAEASENDFDKYRSQAHDAWQRALSAVSVESDNEADKTKFYTAMYHSMLAPTIYDDVDGSYMGPDNKVHKADRWNNYGTFSLWDTYRAAHPLMTYLQPQRTGDFVQSLVAFGRQNGRLPVWNFQASETDMMIGYHSVPVIVDAYMKGMIPDSLAAEALDLCVSTANLDGYRQIGEYKSLGYVPYDLVDEHNSDNWSMSKTLEYAYDDYCIALMADKMGRKDIADEFYARSQNYRNVFNPATGFMQPRATNGEFLPDFNPEDYSEHICESNAWQYLWSVQHDVDGLIDLMGGKERFLQKLDSMMTFNPTEDSSLPIFSTGMIGQYVQGNEPSHHVIYLFNNAGRPDLTQKYISEVVNELYDVTPAGLCGNEDCGQTSAWFVFSAMGFYPVNPVSGVYELGTPLFKSMELRLDNGKTFKVTAPNLSKENIYVKSATLDGVPYEKTFITHDMIMNGSHLELEMSPNPVKNL